jgi:tetratricopeptide (TPR) repeat protein
MVHAVNYDAYKSLDALRAALDIDPNHFFAQHKLAELWYRLRALPKAEEEALRALNLASNAGEFQMARAQLQEIRRLIHNSYTRPTWNKPMRGPALMIAAALSIAGACALWL